MKQMARNLTTAGEGLKMAGAMRFLWCPQIAQMDADEEFLFRISVMYDWSKKGETGSSLFSVE
jgi:hypothetical protein